MGKNKHKLILIIWIAIITFITTIIYFNNQFNEKFKANISSVAQSNIVRKVDTVINSNKEVIDTISNKVDSSFFNFKGKENMPLPPELPPILQQCDSMCQIAKNEYRKGIKVLFIHGLVDISDFNTFRYEYLFKNFGIKVKASCIASILDECYYSCMKELINKEYGALFLDSINDVIEKKFKEQNQEE